MSREAAHRDGNTAPHVGRGWRSDDQLTTFACPQFLTATGDPPDFCDTLHDSR